MLFGHEDKIKVFEKLIQGNTLGQSYLFFGDAQIGKRLFAELLAFRLETGKFEISDEPSIDSKIVFPIEKKSIGIEEALEARKFLWKTPFRSIRRVVIIDEAESLTAEAQGALLKIVEEPPKNALLVFIAHDTQVLFPPLASRLTKIYFKRMPKDKVKKILLEEYGATASRAASISEISFGRIGRAIDLILESSRFSPENSLFKDLEEEILRLRSEGVTKNLKKLIWLIEREVFLKRYNLNQSLQIKAIKYQLSAI